MAQAPEGYRIEHDTMGEVLVPADAQVAGPDPAGGRELPDLRRHDRSRPDPRPGRHQGRGGGRERQAAGRSPRRKAEAIRAAAAEVAAGDWDDHFPIDVFQTGSGTSSNMNMNEVLATLAAERLGEPVHPNDDVNAPLSSNDMFPSAIHIAAARAIKNDLLPALDHLAEALRQEVEGVRQGREVGPHPSDGRHARHPRPGVRRVREPGRAERRAAARRPYRGSASCRSAARAVGTGINVPKGFAAKRDRRGWPTSSTFR